MLCCRYDYRIKYFNLKGTRSQNALALQDVQRLWIPFLVFDNTEKNEATKGTEDTELTLTREGDFIGSEDDNVEEINIFEGQFNRITFEQVKVSDGFDGNDLPAGVYEDLQMHISASALPI